uniref:Uncharacterized protein n=1 Tax=Kalanchoe fedtschenkoi TaxID=63787 RepID=A0A7N0UG15_KALFE
MVLSCFDHKKQFASHYVCYLIFYIKFELDFWKTPGSVCVLFLVTCDRIFTRVPVFRLLIWYFLMMSQ